jgi:hypothetical protein
VDEFTGCAKEIFAEFWYLTRENNVVYECSMYRKYKCRLVYDE